MIKMSKQQIATKEGMKRYWKRRKENEMAKAKNTSKKKARTNARGRVIDTIISMLQRKGGVTREQMLKAIGWKSISMQQVTRKAGYKLKVDDSEHPYKYRVKGAHK